MAKATYLIGYDLHEGEDYKELEDAIKALANGWWHNLDSIWLINSTKDRAQIRDALKPHLINPDEKDGDKLLVAKLEGSWACTHSFSKNAIDWLRNNVLHAC